MCAEFPSLVSLLGAAALEEGDIAGARARSEESLADYRAIGNHYGIADSLWILGTVAREKGDTTAARALFDESLALYRPLDSKSSSASCTFSLGLAARMEGQLGQAEALFAEALEQFHALGIKRNVAGSLAGLALVAADRASGTQAVPSAQRAARLAGATAAHLGALGAPLDRQFRKPYEGAIATARAILGDAAFMAAWEAGKEMSLDEAIAYALTVPLTPLLI